MTTGINDLVGKRALLKLTKGGIGFHNSDVQEMRVLEVSPSGNWAKLMTIHGSKFWRPVTDISLVELLREIKPEPPPRQ